MNDSAENPPPAANRQRYEELLREASRIRGVSLWQDAWKRLRRNRVAMLSLGLLIVVGLSAALTPLLPLQSPIEQDIQRKQFAKPNVESVSLRQSGSGSERELLTKVVADFDKRIMEMRGAASKLTGEAKTKALEEIAEVQEIENPIARVWHKPGPVTEFLIRVRLAIFGDWCVPSICGSDALGRDLLSRLFWGARVSLVVGIVATLVSLAIGVAYGATAGYLGGTIDSIMMRIVDVLYSVPFIFVVIFIMTILDEDSISDRLAGYGIDRITIFYFLIGAIYWLTMSRVVRGQVISLRSEQFVDAARTIGAGTQRIVFRHIVPNVMGIVIVYLTLTIPAVMLFEAFLSFLGLGVEQPNVSWGLLVNEGVQVITPIKIYWWLVLFPGLVLSLTLFALNFLGDGLRDALDPRMKNR